MYMYIDKWFATTLAKLRTYAHTCTHVYTHHTHTHTVCQDRIIQESDILKEFLLAAQKVTLTLTYDL